RKFDATPRKSLCVSQCSSIVRLTVVEMIVPGSPPSSPRVGEATEYRRTLCGLPHASTPGGITPNACPGRNFPASGVPEMSMSTCRTNPAAFFVVHSSDRTIRPTTGSVGRTMCISTSGRGTRSVWWLGVAAGLVVAVIHPKRWGGGAGGQGGPPPGPLVRPARVQERQRFAELRHRPADARGLVHVPLEDRRQDVQRPRGRAPRGVPRRVDDLVAHQTLEDAVRQRLLAVGHLREGAVDRQVDPPRRIVQ